MKEHHTKTKGDLAVAKTLLDLCEKGYIVFSPVICEHLPFDLIAYKDNICYRIQCKYSVNKNVVSKTVWSDKNGIHVSDYKENDFDYYAIYLPDKDVVCYPAFSFHGARLQTVINNSATPFYWYEDFLTFTDSAQKRSYRDFGIELTFENRKGPKPNARKVIRPSKEELEKLLWTYTMVDLASQFGVSDKAIAKWAKAYGIQKPPIGHWIKKDKTKDIV